ncbi:MAG: hypothetical protein E6G68_09765 [Actinobacteria bacterium]|nr:MAG: hypothetical protein E6G68_09765 [Actinomycetota bacterium]
MSFDRPYKWPGSGGVFAGEFQTIELMESHGLDVGYATSIDLDRGKVALPHRRVFLSAGHDEYYSGAMRSALETALAGGTSLAFATSVSSLPRWDRTASRSTTRS